MSLATMLRTSMQVLPAKVVRQYGGASDYQWDDAGPQYPCDLQPTSATKRVTLQVLGIDPTHNLFFNPADVTLGAEDRIKVEGKTYKVLSLEQSGSVRNREPGLAYVTEARL
jgi:hypothetical protein